MRRRRNGLGRLTLLALIPVIMLLLLGVAEAYWVGRISVVTNVEIGVWRICIKDTRIIENPNGSHVDGEPRITDDTVTVYRANLTDQSHIWIALLVENTGTVPVELLDPSVQIHASSKGEEFQVEASTYQEPDPDLWRGTVNAEQLPIKQPAAENPTLKPGEEATILVELRVQTGNQTIEETVVTVKVRYRA